MNSSVILSNILNPPVLFFFLGMLAILLQSDLEIPQPLPKLFSLYLLLAIGFKGGYEIDHSGISPQIALTLLAAIFMASVVPIYSF
ncbi:MAG: sodium-dependent bicarbonate transport family permease, partial [Cuspidothrix sp.]